jgi:hypothetical protein
LKCGADGSVIPDAREGSALQLPGEVFKAILTRIGD